MLYNYIRTAVRNILQQKGFSLINILGLTLGLSTALFIFLWVYDESSFDVFHENIDQIYRVEQSQDYDGKIFHVNVTPYPSGEGWKEAIPEIQDAVRMTMTGTLLCESGGKRFYENSILPVDSSFFQVFSFPLLHGHPEKVLSEPNSIVLTEESALKYFGTTMAVGEVMTVDNQYNLTVTGIVGDFPDNSTITFDFLVPFDFTRTVGMYNDSWTSNSIQTYVLLNENSAPGPVDAKLTQTVMDHIDWSTRDNGPEDYLTAFNLAPMRKMHLHSYFGFNHTKGAYRSVLIMSIIGIFILIIASINYMNLATARSAKRAREIGLRKVSGGYRHQIVRQFFTESLLTSFIAVVSSIVVVALLMDSFRLVSGKTMPTSIILSTPFLLSLIGMGLFTGLLAGIYPAIFLSGFKPVKVLYGDPSNKSGKGILRKVLVIVQFSMSLLLIIGTTVVFSQNTFLSKFDRGYSSENVMYIRLFGDMNNSYPMIRDAIRQLPDVKYVSASNQRPGSVGSNGGGIRWDGIPEDLNPLVSQSVVGFDYFKLLNIPVVAGRNFSEETPADYYSDSTGSFIINETLARIIDKEDIVGMDLTFMGISAPIIGIVKDFCFTSLRSEIPPLAVVVSAPEYLRFVGIKLGDGDQQAIVSKIESAWNEVMPDFPFEYTFLADDFVREDRSNARMGHLLLVFTIIAILIACLGLLGLSAFMAEKRTREIGIRKTLGASSWLVIQLMVRQFVGLILLATVVSIPLAYLLMDSFLQDFANRIQLNWILFAGPAVLILFLATLTVSIYALKASRTSPSICLRYE